MTRPSQPAPANRAGRQHAQAQALAALQRQAAAAPADPYLWWQQLLAEEAALQQREAVMTVCNLRWSHAFWNDLHNRSEALAHQMAACIQQLEAQR
jgi:hypothetical protein